MTWNPAPRRHRLSLTTKSKFSTKSRPPTVKWTQKQRSLPTAYYRWRKVWEETIITLKSTSEHGSKSFSRSKATSIGWISSTTRSQARTINKTNPLRMLNQSLTETTLRSASAEVESTYCLKMRSFSRPRALSTKYYNSWARAPSARWWSALTWTMELFTP